MSLYHTKAASWQDIARVCIPTSLGPGQDNRRSRVPKPCYESLGFSYIPTFRLAETTEKKKKPRRCQLFSRHSLQMQLSHAAQGSTWSGSRPPDTVSISPSCGLENKNTVHSQPPCSLKKHCHHKILQSLGCVYKKSYFFF